MPMGDRGWCGLEDEWEGEGVGCDGRLAALEEAAATTGDEEEVVAGDAAVVEEVVEVEEVSLSL